MIWRAYAKPRHRKRTHHVGHHPDSVPAVVWRRQRQGDTGNPTRHRWNSGALSAGLLAIIVIGLLLGGGWITDRVRLGRYAAAERHRAWIADSTAAENLSRALEAEQGMATQFAEIVNLEDRLAASDSARQEILAINQAQNARIVSLTQLYVGAQSEITAMANRMERDSVTGAVTASGVLDDGLLSAEWVCEVPPGSLTLDPYRVTLAGEIYHSETGDGRLLAAARFPDPRVDVQIPGVFVDPPPPIVDHSIRLRDRLRLWLEGAAVAGVASWVLKR